MISNLPWNTRKYPRLKRYPEIQDSKKDTQKYPIIYFNTPTRPEPNVGHLFRVGCTFHILYKTGMILRCQCDGAFDKWLASIEDNFQWMSLQNQLTFQGPQNFTIVHVHQQVMQKPSREAQKSFTWDASVGPAIHVDANPGPTRKYKHNKMAAKYSHKSLIAFFTGISHTLCWQGCNVSRHSPETSGT